MDNLFNVSPCQKALSEHGSKGRVKKKPLHRSGVDRCKGIPSLEVERSFQRQKKQFSSTKTVADTLYPLTMVNISRLGCNLNIFYVPGSLKARSPSKCKNLKSWENMMEEKTTTNTSNLSMTNSTITLSTKLSNASY